MSKHITLLLLAALLSVASAFKYISDIAVDEPSGQIYVAQGTQIYELDNVAVSQNAVHTLPFSSPVDAGTLFVMKRGNKRALYFYADDGVSTTKLGYTKAPIGNQAVLPAQNSIDLPPGLSLAPTYDDVDNLGIFSVSRNLTLVNLNNLKVTDTMTYWVGSRIFGRNVVYNHENNHAVIFKTHVPVGGSYGLNVEEFDLSTGKFVSTPTQYNCLCETNPAQSPFYKVVFPEASCSIDYINSPTTIYCPAPDQKQIFTFKADNLGVYSVINVNAQFATIAWDFANKVGYAIYGNNDEEDVVGFTINKVNLATGAILKTHTESTIAIDSYTFELDPSQPHLYIAAANYDDAEPTQIVSVNTNTLAVKVANLA